MTWAVCDTRSITSPVRLARPVLPDIVSFIHNRYGKPAPSYYPTIQTDMTTGTNGSVVTGEGELPAGTVALENEDGDGPAAAAEYKLAYVVLDFLRSSVRPVLTYGFFVLFVYVKLVALKQALAVDHTHAIDLLPIVWDEGTEALFAAVLSFWFGSRAIARFRQK